MNAIDATSLAQFAPAPEPKPAESHKEAAQQAEAMFVRSLLKEVRKSLPEDSPMNSPEMAMFNDLLDEKLAEQISESGQLGLAEAIEAAMGGPSTNPSAHGHRSYLAQTGSVEGTPVHGHVTSGFGHRHHPILKRNKMHYGIDIGAPSGTPIRSMRPGVVTFAGPKGSYGNLVIVDHGDGLETRYAHAKATHVRKGDRVERGSLLASVGSTGRSTGPHLHFEVRQDGKAIDPAPYLQRPAQNDPKSDPTSDR
ncbi:MAG: peptidoglycan DD-metalloendopeptidase family protein [Myxococcota bacterium]